MMDTMGNVLAGKAVAVSAMDIFKLAGGNKTIQFDEGFDATVDWYLANEKWLNNVTSGSYQEYYRRMYGE